MSRTYRLLRNGSDFQGVEKVWVLVNKRGSKKFQRMINKRCRRLDKITISEGLNEIIDDRKEYIASLEELFDDWYEEDLTNWYEDDPIEDLQDEKDPFEDPLEDLSYWDDELYDSLYF